MRVAKGGLFHLDLALCRKPRAEKHRAHTLTEARLREQEEVVDSAPQDRQRGDHARLRGEKQGLARLTKRKSLDVVRDHRLEVRRGVRTAHRDELTRAAGNP